MARGGLVLLLLNLPAQTVPEFPLETAATLRLAAPETFPVDRHVSRAARTATPPARLLLGATSFQQVFHGQPSIGVAGEIDQDHGGILDRRRHHPREFRHDRFGGELQMRQLRGEIIE